MLKRLTGCSRFDQTVKMEMSTFSSYLVIGTTDGIGPTPSPFLNLFPPAPASLTPCLISQGEGSVLHITSGDLFKLNFYAELAN